jgi:hypothetical protein
MEAAERIKPYGYLGVMRYDRAEFPWRYAIGCALGCHDLENLHKYAGHRELDDHHKLQGTVWHSRYYGQFDAIVRPLYMCFLEWLKVILDADELVYQSKPTFRVHMPGSVAVHEWHKDGDYGHADGELNVWLPVTKSAFTQTIFVGDRPQNLNIGEALLFDGTNLAHGNKINCTNQTRVSVDFRIAHKAFKPSGSTSVSAGRSFSIGPAYFERC